MGDIGDFQKIADSFIVIFDAVSKEVETEKMKVYDFRFDSIARILQGNVQSKTLMTGETLQLQAIRARNLLKSYDQIFYYWDLSDM